MKKKKLYSDLLDRQRTSLEAGFYYESCWFAHAIFEDRSRSIVANTGDGQGYGGAISEKLSLIFERLDATKTKVAGDRPVKDKRTGKKIRVPKWPLIHTVERRMVEEVREWTKERNDLVHALASGKISLSDADQRAKKLSVIGANLTKEMCAAAQRIKKHATKLSDT